MIVHDSTCTYCSLLFCLVGVYIFARVAVGRETWLLHVQRYRYWPSMVYVCVCVFAQTSCTVAPTNYPNLCLSMIVSLGVLWNPAMLLFSARTSPFGSIFDDWVIDGIAAAWKEKSLCNLQSVHFTANMKKSHTHQIDSYPFAVLQYEL